MNPATSRNVSRRAAARLAVGGFAAALTASARASAAQEATPEVPVAVETGLAFAEVEGQSLLLDVYRPPSRAAPRPAVLVIPGWGGGRDYLAPNARAFAAAGYVAFVIDYRLSYASFVDDAWSALRWVRERAATFEVAPERVGAYGHSAGAHLAVLLAVGSVRGTATSSPVVATGQAACAVAIASPGDAALLERAPETVAILSEVSGQTPEQVLDWNRSHSPVALVDGGSAPMLLQHGGQDQLLPPAHALALATALQTAGVEMAYDFVPGADHFTIVEWELGGDFALAFLGRHLQPER